MIGVAIQKKAPVLSSEPRTGAEFLNIELNVEYKNVPLHSYRLD